MAIAAALTVDEYEALPDSLTQHYELIDGELVEVANNNLEHNLLRDRLWQLLSRTATENDLGLVIAEQQFDFDGNTHAPDVSFIRTNKLRLLDLKLRVQRFVPDLAIEIASPSDKFEGLMKKIRRYVDCGAKEAWLFSIEMRLVQVHLKGKTLFLDDEQQLSSEQLPGLSIRIGDLFDCIRQGIAE